MSSLFSTSTSTSTCTFGFVRKTHSQSNWIYKVGVVPHRRLPHTSILFCLSRFGFAPNRIFTAQETWKRLQSQNAAYNNVGNVVTLFLLLLHTDLHSLNSLSIPTRSDKLHTCKRYSCQRQLFRFVLCHFYISTRVAHRVCNIQKRNRICAISKNKMEYSK